MTVKRLFVHFMYEKAFGFTALLPISPVGFTKEYKFEDCDKAEANGGPLAMAECHARNTHIKERHLQDVYKQAFALATRKAPEMADELKQSQESWEAYSKKNCNFQGHYIAFGGAGSWGARYASNCYSDAVDKRVQYLEDLVQSKGAFGP